MHSLLQAPAWCISTLSGNAACCSPVPSPVPSTSSPSAGSPSGWQWAGVQWLEVGTPQQEHSIQPAERDDRQCDTTHLARCHQTQHQLCQDPAPINCWANYNHMALAARQNSCQLGTSLLHWPACLRTLTSPALANSSSSRCCCNASSCCFAISAGSGAGAAAAGVAAGVAAAACTACGPATGGTGCCACCCMVACICIGCCTGCCSAGCRGCPAVSMLPVGEAGVQPSLQAWLQDAS
jgi:hypothetical protein